MSTTTQITLDGEIAICNKNFTGKTDGVNDTRTRVFLRPQDEDATKALSSRQLGKMIATTDILAQIAERLDIDIDEDVEKLKFRQKDGMYPSIILQGHTGYTLAIDVTAEVTEIEVEDEVEEDSDVTEAPVSNKVDSAEPVEA